MSAKKEYPILYWCRGAGGSRDKSDKGFILPRMAVIPEHLKHEVSEEYERLFLQGGRKPANKYLHEIAAPYRDQLKAQKNGDYGQKVDQTQTPPRNRKTILGMAEQAKEQQNDKGN